MPAAPPDPGPALCLSGGGFRATLFHLGAVRRLHELGALARVRVVTSVSGGSILNGVLATRWAQLTGGNFDTLVARPVRQFCENDLRTRLLLLHRANPQNWPKLLRTLFAVPAAALAAAYTPAVPGTLAQLPDPATGAPRFVFCATNTVTGACWQFHGGPAARMGDFYAGYRPAGAVAVADAVAASSAFPPGFAPLRLAVPPADADHRLDPWGEPRPTPRKRAGQRHWQDPHTAFLTDGGVYDNLGVEPVWERCGTVLVSDAQRLFSSARGGSPFLVSRLLRASDVGMEQVGAVRRRWLIERFRAGTAGCFWGLSTPPTAYGAAPPLAYGQPLRDLMQEVRTDLNAFDAGEAGALENHGYLLADVSVRAKLPAWHTGAAFRWPAPAVQPDGAGDAAARAALARSGERRWLRGIWQALRHA